MIHPSKVHSDAAHKGLPAMLSVAMTLLIALSGSALAADAQHSDHSAKPEPALADHPPVGAAAADPHAHHRHMLESKGYNRSVHSYQPPDLTLVNMDGKEARLFDELNRDQPVMLNFIFTTCTTICPVLSATFAQVKQKLGTDVDQVRMVSITIDPEHDTPERLHAYAARFEAGPQWRFLTGDLDAIVAVQKAFDAYRGNKMSHEPLTFLRASADAPWIRIDGIASAAEVMAEYRQLVAGAASVP